MSRRGGATAEPVRSGAWLGTVQIRACRRSHEKPGGERAEKYPLTIRKALRIRRAMNATQSEITPTAQRQIGELLDTMRRMENAELDTITGWDATPRLENIRSVIDQLIDAQETLNDCL